MQDGDFSEAVEEPIRAMSICLRGVPFDVHRAVTLLQQRGSRVANVRNNLDQTILHIFARKDLPEYASLAIARGAEVNLSDRQGWQPLRWTCTSTVRSVRVARVLLMNGADVRATAGDGWAPIHAAAYHDNVQHLKLFLDYGAHVDDLTRGGASSLHLAASVGRQAAVEELLRRGASVHLRNESGLRAIDLALTAGQAYVVEMLVRAENR